MMSDNLQKKTLIQPVADHHSDGKAIPQGDSGGHGESEAFDPAPHRPTRRTLAWTVIGAGIAILALVAVGVIPRLVHSHATRVNAEKVDAEPARVLVVHPAHAARGGGVSLPSSIEPVQETVVYARTNGYVRKYLVDIGDNVKANQTLATLDTPEIDQELRQAEAALIQARAVVEQNKAQRELARTTKDRYVALGPSGYVSKQELEDKSAGLDAQTANVNAADAAVNAAQANVRRYQDLKSFSVVQAPFAGVVTSRTVEDGQLVSAGSGAGQALFKVAKVDVMRLFINVPQTYAPSVKVDQVADVSIREYPDKTFKGVVSRTARELDSGTRTLRTEVRIDNKDGLLISGMYAQVNLKMKRTEEPLLIPATALMANTDGTRVATVSDGKVVWKKITVENDLGSEVSVAAGVTADDLVVLMPSDKLIEGMKIDSKMAPAKPAPPTAAPAGSTPPVPAAQDKK